MLTADIPSIILAISGCGRMEMRDAAQAKVLKQKCSCLSVLMISVLSNVKMYYISI